MSSRILAPDTPIEPLRWRAGGGPEDEAQNHHARSPSENHKSADPAKTPEIEGRIKVLEAQLEDEKRAAWELGRREGIAASAAQEAAHWGEALGRLGRAIEDISQMKTRFRTEVEEDAVKLALAIARKVLNRELATDPEALAGLARIALDKLNLRELQRLRVHPSDATAMQRLLGVSPGPKRVEVIADGSLERGGAIFETDRGALDASVTTQLDEIERGLADRLGGRAK